MVKAVVVKGGGAGNVTNLTCSEIFACFDPPIDFGPHGEMQGSLDSRESYDAKAGEGWQAEHFPPAGTMHQTGRGGAGSVLLSAVQGSSYTTGSALTWMVHDGQTGGREHKILTDAMRQFSQENHANHDRRATLKEWLEKYKDGAKDALKNANPKRTNNRPDLDEDSLINAAAECIQARAKEFFDSVGVNENTQLRNPWKSRQDQRDAVAAREAGIGGDDL